MTADLVFLGGRILTLDRDRPEVEAVAVTGGRIAAVGAATDVAALRDHRTRVVELGQRTLLPGFYDAHQHQLYAGLARRNVDGRAPSLNVLLARIEVAAARVTEGAWIEGGGYDERQLAERRAPTRAELDRAAPNHPVLLTRTCGHCMVVNTRALVAAGITSTTADLPGGVIEREIASRQPSGVLHERAMELVRKIVPQPQGDTLEDAILDEAQGNLRLGITSVWEPSIEPPHLDAYRRLDRESRLPIRVTMAHKKVLRSGDTVSLPAPFRSDRLSLVAAKLFQDGAIGARTAAVSTGYAGDPDNKGVLVWEQPQLDEFVNEIHTSGYQVSIHAIGDLAIASALEAIEDALLGAPRADHRHRIEHCGIVASLAPRIARAGVVPVLQPVFVRFHGDTYLAHLPDEAARTLYPVRMLQETCGHVAGSSDSPVVPDRNPLTGIKAAMLRTTLEGQRIASTQAVSLDGALALYGPGAAYAAHEDRSKGTLTPGKLADLVVLDGDIRAVEPNDLDELRAVTTFLGGEQVTP